MLKQKGVFTSWNILGAYVNIIITSCGNVAVNFSFQVIFFCLCFIFISVHYRTQKQCKNKN